MSRHVIMGPGLQIQGFQFRCEIRSLILQILILLLLVIFLAFITFILGVILGVMVLIPGKIFRVIVSRLPVLLLLLSFFTIFTIFFILLVTVHTRRHRVRSTVQRIRWILEIR